VRPVTGHREFSAFTDLEYPSDLLGDLATLSQQSGDPNLHLGPPPPSRAPLLLTAYCSFLSSAIAIFGRYQMAPTPI
jgi:hypothetical protein